MIEIILRNVREEYFDAIVKIVSEVISAGQKKDHLDLPINNGNGTYVIDAANNWFCMIEEDGDRLILKISYRYERDELSGLMDALKTFLIWKFTMQFFFRN